LEVAEVLFAEAGLFVDADGVAGEGGGGGGGGGEGVEDAFCCFAGAAVGGGEEVEGVGWVEEGAQFYACFFGLGGGEWLVGGFGGGGMVWWDLFPAIWGELDAVVGHCLVDVSVF